MKLETRNRRQTEGLPNRRFGRNWKHTERNLMRPSRSLKIPGWTCANSQDRFQMLTRSISRLRDHLFPTLTSVFNPANERESSFKFQVSSFGSVTK
ncbi:MAG: hypothetical protein DRJ61_11690 [Acidobacteria bacterium]|nr:MAG: hypothetical protein DRJ61_11690 [Acidobacteriota bacterium]